MPKTAPVKQIKNMLPYGVTSPELTHYGHIIMAT